MGPVSLFPRLAIAALLAGLSAPRTTPVPAQGPPPCDSVVHDTLTGAQFRSPSGCEVAFAASIRQAEHRAFAPVITALGRDHWMVRSETPTAPIAGVARGLEKGLFRPVSTTGGDYLLELMLDPNSPVAKTWAGRLADATAKMQAEMRDTGRMGGAYDAFAAVGREATGATTIAIRVTVNALISEFTTFDTRHTPLDVPGAAFAAGASRVQAQSGGDVSNAPFGAAFAYLGQWRPPVVTALPGGGERVHLDPAVPASAPYLSVQTLAIRIECNPELSNAVLKQIDWAALRSLLPGQASK
jgi:hypothetical protein